MLRWIICVGVLLLAPGVVTAADQPPVRYPFSNPELPWFLRDPPALKDHGTVVRYWEVPPQQVAIQVFVSGPGSFSGEYQQQVVEIPGYVVTETTTAFIYPQRTVLEQVAPGVYQWRVLPQTFQRK